MIHIGYDQFDPLTRLHFWLFVRRVYAELNPGTPYLDNFHIQYLANELESMRTGDIRRVAVTMPPRSLKSLVISIAWPAWLMGHDSTLRIICASYGQELADKLASDCRQVMQAGWYQRLFPKCRLRPGRQALGNYETTAGGVRVSTSVGGAMTGLGADWIIVDDAQKPEQALSEAERATSNNWVRQTLFTRLNDKARGRILIVMQRLHQDDLIGHLLERAPGSFHLVSFPAIAPDDRLFEYRTPWGRERHQRLAGDALHPAREPLAVLEEQRTLLGAAAFSAQYDQEPVPADGNLIKRAWLRSYAPLEAFAFDRIIQSWDTAAKTGVANDYSVGITFGLKGDRIHVLDVARERLDFPTLKQRVIELADRYRAELVLIEDQGSGIGLLQELQASNFWRARPIKAAKGKAERLVGISAMIEAGRLLLPQAAPWLETYTAELCGFPQVRNDDQVDATSQALAWIRDQKTGDGLLTYYQQLADRERAYQEHRTVHFRAPSGVSHVTMVDGTTLPVLADGTIWVTEANARGLHLAGFQQLSASRACA